MANQFSVYCLILTFVVSSQQCTDPQIVSTSYTTQDATVLKQVAYISNFQVNCKNGQPGKLYARYGNNLSPVASVGPGKYQISWTEDIKTARIGATTVKLYNETGYSTLRKAMRAGEDVSNKIVFAEVVVEHEGIFGGPWFSFELLAAAISIGIAYIAIEFRSQILR